MTQISASQLECLRSAVRALYGSFQRALPFHGWHHVSFVTQKSISLAQVNGADLSLVEAAALVHDLNYMVDRNSGADSGASIRESLFIECSFDSNAIVQIEEIVDNASIEMRSQLALSDARAATMTLEMQALSDADTLYKALPITPVMLAHRYMAETGATVRELADRILRDQEPLLNAGTYFFDRETRAQYERWALANVELWKAIRESLHEPEVARLVEGLEEQ